MLRPMPIEPVPPETARVARAACPQGIAPYALLTSWTRSLRTHSAPLSFPPLGNWLWLPGARRW
jgi:hypothetical protein